MDALLEFRRCGSFSQVFCKRLKWRKSRKPQATQPSCCQLHSCQATQAHRGWGQPPGCGSAPEGRGRMHRLIALSGHLHFAQLSLLALAWDLPLPQAWKSCLGLYHRKCNSVTKEREPRMPGRKALSQNGTITATKFGSHPPSSREQEDMPSWSTSQKQDSWQGGLLCFSFLFLLSFFLFFYFEMGSR